MFSKVLCNKNLIFSLHFREFYTTSFYNKNHYDILQLKRDCSCSDIRNSYLKLSKQYHPDKNKDENTHKTFVKISEAYNILSKPKSRRDYDLGLENPDFFHNNVHVRTAKPTNVWTDDSFWEHRDKTKDEFYKSQPYYGIKGVKKISNIWIVFLCIGFTAFGVILQILAIRRSFTLKRDDMEQRSIDLETLHSEIRAKALENGDKKQLELLIAKLKPRSQN